MTNMRRGFTMIELIFVIVIIGILAAVAIPKLSATRDDAKATKTVANLRTLLEDVQNYYTANGDDAAVNPSKAWGLPAVTYEQVTGAIPSQEARLVATGPGAVLNIRETEGTAGKICFTITETIRPITINGRSVNQRILTVTDGADAGTSQCLGAMNLAEDKGLHGKTASDVVVFAGQGVAY